MRRRRLPGAAPSAPTVQSYLQDTFTRRLSESLHTTGAGSCYIKTKEWLMMADLASIKNGSQDLSYLEIPAFRTHGGGLGDSVTKFSDTARQSEHLSSCPWCRSPATDDACHAVGCCMHPSSVPVRTEHTSAILSMLAHYKTTMAWRLDFDKADNGRERARLILNVACQPNMLP